MRTILLATGYREELAPLISFRPSPLFRVLDRPIIEPVIEFLITHDIHQYDIFLSHLPAMIEAHLHEGHRWGAQFTYHLIKDANSTFYSLKHILEQCEDTPVFLTQADALPLFSFEELLETYRRALMPTLLFYPSKTWSGWGIFPASFFHKIPKETTLDNLFSYLTPTQYKIVKALPFLSVYNFIDWQKSNQKLISKKSQSMHYPFFYPSTANLIEPGVWVSRAATLHSTVKIRPPVFIGEYCQIKAHAQIGPNVIIENNSVVDSKSLVEDSLICQQSYVGEGLEIRSCIIDRRELINLQHNTKISIENDFILGELKPPSFRDYLLKSLGKYLAFFLIVLLSPLFLFLYLTRYVYKYPVILLPASLDPLHWKTVTLFYFAKTVQNDPPIKPKGYLAALPLLFNILRGELHFTGVPPRTRAEVESLSSDWRRFYLNSKMGLITLAMVEQTTNPSQENLYTAEAYYVANTGLWYDIKLCIRWLFHLK